MYRLLNLAQQLADDDHGFVVSAELIAVSTIAVLGMIVGLSEVGHAITQETEDVATGFGAVNQSFSVQVPSSSHFGLMSGSSFNDSDDFCDTDCDIHADWTLNGESGGVSNGGGNQGGGGDDGSNGGGTTGSGGNNGGNNGGGTGGGGMNGGGMGGGGMMGPGAD